MQPLLVRASTGVEGYHPRRPSPVNPDVTHVVDSWLMYC
jgi:hypothetical protein